MRLSSPFKIAKFGTFFCHLCSGCLQHKRYTLIVALFLLETVWRTSEDWSLGTSSHPKIPDFFAQIKPIEHLAGEIIRRSSASTLTSRLPKLAEANCPVARLSPFAFWSGPQRPRPWRLCCTTNDACSPLKSQGAWCGKTLARSLSKPESQFHISNSAN